jgi:hypothetical protein
MRKRLIAAVTAAAVLALGVGVAFAENTYNVDLASSTPAGKGSPSKPIPAKLRFGYKVGDSEGLRPTVIEQYRIAPEGLVTYPKLFPTCTYAQSAARPEPAAACKKAQLGSGQVFNHAGPAGDRAAPPTICNLRLRLYNISGVGKNGGMAIRLDGGPGQEPAPGCTLDIAESIKAKFTTVKVDGLKTSELRFTVPEALYLPLPGVENAVINTVSTVNKRTARTRIKGKRRTVGYYSKIGCKGRTRTTRVEFVDLEGRKFTASKPSPC